MDYCITNFVKITNLKKFKKILEMCESDDGGSPEIISTKDSRLHRNEVPVKYGFISSGINGFRVPEYADKCRQEKCFDCKKREECNDNETDLEGFFDELQTCISPDDALIIMTTYDDECEGIGNSYVTVVTSQKIYRMPDMWELAEDKAKELLGNDGWEMIMPD